MNNEQPAGRVYQVIDSQTGHQVGNDYTSRNRARARRDHLDLQHGACRYRINIVYEQSIGEELAARQVENN